MNLKTALQWHLCMLLALALVPASPAFQINLTSSTNIYVDLTTQNGNLYGDHVALIITNNSAQNYSNLWVTLGSFTNGVLKLGGGDPGKFPLNTLLANQAKPSFFYLMATNGSGMNQFSATIYNGYPTTGTPLFTNNFQVQVLSSSYNNANKVNSVSYSPAGSPVLGGIVKISVTGVIGNVNNGREMAFTAAAFTNWNAGVFQLMACNITITNTSGNAPYILTNSLDQWTTNSINGSGNSGGYEADYWMRVISTTNGTTPVSPVSYINNGGGSTSINHVDSTTLTGLPPVQPATNQTTMNVLTNFVQVYTNETVTFTLRVTNASAVGVTLDRFVDTLPAGLVYIANSSTFGGVAILNPTNASQVLTWSQGYNIPASTSRDFTFQATPTNLVSSYFTNSCVAYVLNSQIDTTLDTSDNAPAIEVVRALIAPIAQNISTNVLENKSLTVAAPGVLANTVEPNGFGATIVSYTQPAHGSATVNADGSYVYTPTAFYWGIDSFTFTMTNQNGRASTATNNLTVNWVNQPPYFTKGTNVATLENSGGQIVANWAGGISSGTNDPAQTLTFQVSNDNSNLFSVQPQISSNGTLTYTPAAFSYGTATVTAYLTDDGGTANGGTNASPLQTFTITVNWVNQPPNFMKGSDQTVLEDSGAQTVSGWATGINSGTNDPAQTLTFHASNNNSNLFSAQPSVSTNGTLTFTPAANANGSAMVTIYLTDDGSGNNTSATQTFAINVTAVNDPPTINAISNLMLIENWNLQTVNFNGVTVGPTNENGQTLTVTATSSNPSLVPNPMVNYTSANTNGTLTFTPTTNSFGSATITVVVKDDGGTANGGIDSVTNTFNVTLLGLTNYWFGGSNLVVNIFDSSSASQTNYFGVLSVPATSANPFIIKPTGLAANFNSQSNYTWTIATTTRGVEGFATNKIIFDTGAFTNDLAGGYFAVSLSGDGGSVNLIFVGNHGPAASAAAYSRAFNTAIRIPIANLLTNYTTDPDGDARILVSAGASTNGSIITTNSLYINFGPTNNFTETFPYVVRDNRTYRPGDTVLYATNWITILAVPTVGYANTITPNGNGSLSIKFAGIPKYAYDIQRATNPGGPWSTIWTTNAPPNGIWIFIDTNPPQPAAFYRTQQH